MLQGFIIGNVGADAKVQTKDGREFITFRVAHNDRWTGQDGTEHESSMWVDCIMSQRTKVVDFLKAGQLVYVAGRLSTRVYSSQKDRCMKAGLTINVERVELLGAKSAAVPARLYDTNGIEHPVAQYFNTEVHSQLLFDRNRRQYVSDENGWILPFEQAPADVQQRLTQQASTSAAPATAEPAAPQQAEILPSAVNTNEKASKKS